MKVKNFLVFVFCSLVLLSASGQQTYVAPQIPEKAIKALNEAVLASGAGTSEKPVDDIKSLIERYPQWLTARHQLSRILYDRGRKVESIEALRSSIAIDTQSQIAQLYSLGRLYEETGAFDEAFKAYNAVVEKGIHHPNLLQKAVTGLQGLETKLALLTSDYTVEFIPFPDPLNSPDYEYLGRWNINGNELVFTRRWQGQEDLLIARFDDAGKLLTIDEHSINSDLNEAGHTISPDGKYLVFTSCDRYDGMGGCDLYLSVYKDSKWTAPVNMGPSFNSAGWDSQPVFGLDGMSIYFSSNRPGGFGGSDIWMVQQLSRGQWSSPINLGPQINTSQNEESPYMHFDGRSMYFRRDGNMGLGGFDLYITRQELDGKWTKPVNMGSPINSPADEGGLALHPDGKNAIMTRSTPDRKDDLYLFRLPEKYQADAVQRLHVHITDIETGKPVRARLEIFESTQPDTIRLSQWADENGHIQLVLQQDKWFGIISSAEGYLIHSSQLSPDTSAVRRIDIGMVPLKTAANKAVVLKNIFFETGSAKLLPSSFPELNILHRSLHELPQLEIELRGHTDNVGTEEDNQQLSEDRARAVYQYLIDRGIDASRLSFAGFGEMQPVDTNETDAGRQQNRRTEFVIKRM